MTARVVRVDPSVCVGSATCSSTAPGVFALDQEAGVARVISQDGAPITDIEEAVSLCPVEAIAWETGDRDPSSGASPA
ncbi:ferredoxin [Amycolatopsis acidiphila]|uniref:Ferredoxin n=1 Tax=Amycolatopsis acidiphila TaxID=715473 RepID=A0A558AI39_9PSEU|nr:ferredoxin [Amycolatopsis acidiphila]GHG86580.1 hypothetical protein GCM10017788_59820 [Amycolatopsis acidiphila]